MHIYHYISYRCRHMYIPYYEDHQKPRASFARALFCDDSWPHHQSEMLWTRYKHFISIDHHIVTHLKVILCI